MKDYTRLALVIALIGTAAVLSFSFHRGLILGDAAFYLKYAAGLLEGNLADHVQENVFANRIGTYVPYAAGMALFGIGDHLNWIPFIQFAILLILVYGVLAAWNVHIALWVTAILAFSEIMLQWSAITMGDLMATLSLTAPVLLYFYFKKTRWSLERARRWGIGLGLLFIGAVLVKESAAFFVPLLAFWGYRDRTHPVGKRFWMSAVITIAMGGFGIMGWYWTVTGDPLFRLHVVEYGPSMSDCNYAGASWIVIVKRLTYEPFRFLTNDYSFGILFLFGILNIFRTARTWEEQFFKEYLVITLGMWWLGTQSLSSWNPVALVYRLWLPLMVPLAINAVVWIYHMMQGTLLHREKRTSIFLMLLLVIAACINLRYSFIEYQIQGLWSGEFIWSGIKYCLIGSIALGALIVSFPFERWRNALGIFLLFCVTCSQMYGLVLGVIFHPQQIWNYSCEKDSLKMLESLADSPVLAEEALSSGYGIYTGFDKKINFTDWSGVPLPRTGMYLFINRLSLKSLEQNLSETHIFTKRVNHVPDYVKYPEHHGFCLVNQTATHQLYRIE